MSVNRNIKFIFFDVGGVALLDFSKTNKWQEMLADLGIKDDIRDDFSTLFERYELAACVGLDLSEFIRAAESELEIKFPTNYLMVNDFVSRFTPNPELGQIIEKLPGKYKLGLLTNVYLGMLTEINNQKLLPEVEWDVIVDSSIVKVRKPQAEIYEIAERESNTQPENILFVENSQTHIDVAKARGWQTFLYDPANVTESNKRLLELL